MKTACALAIVVALLGADPPAAPTGLAATTPVNGRINLAWNSVAGVSGYNVYRAPVSAGNYVKLNGALITATSTVDLTVTVGTPYFYVVRSVNSSQEESVNSSEVTATPTGTDATAPAAPTISSSSRKTKDSTPSTTGTAEPGSTVFLYAGSTQIGTTTAAPTGVWTIGNPSSLGSDGLYAITARARDAALNLSPYSTAINITLDTISPAAPTGTRTTRYWNCVDVEWFASTSNDVAGYKVERKTASGAWTLLNTANLIHGTRYRDSTATNGTTYFYRVIAVDDALEN
ncbi:MAG TPA: Ig-like domain-containing protein [Gemmatimonadales bacterium]|nr:Ig-like domain-containing protein [Gemmatimonadales bacterium]